MFFPWEKFDLTVTCAGEMAPKALPATRHCLAWLLPAVGAIAASQTAPYPRRHRPGSVLQAASSATCRKTFFSPVSTSFRYWILSWRCLELYVLICYFQTIQGVQVPSGDLAHQELAQLQWCFLFSTAVVYSWESCRNYSTVALRISLYFDEFIQLHVPYLQCYKI